MAIILLIFQEIKNNIYVMKILLFLIPYLVILIVIFPVNADTNTRYAYEILVEAGESGVNKPIFTLVTIYQKHISPHDGPRCLYYPTCSEFYKTAQNNFGFLWGTLMVIDRLFYREGWSSVKYYEYIPDKNSYSDPVYHNYIFKKKDYYR